jgi:hypothetical protein
MSVQQIAQSRAKEIITAFMEAAFSRKQMTRSDFQRAVYGIDDKGRPRGSGQMYPMLGGTLRISDNTIKRWAPVLGVAEKDLEALREEADAFLAKPQALVAKQDVVPATAASPPWVKTPSVAKMSAALSIAEQPKAGPPQFSLIVDQQGAATLRLNLVDIPMTKAMQVMQALAAAGLISGLENQTAPA